MKKIFVLLLAFVTTSCLFAQSTNSNVESVIRKLEHEENLAVLNHNTAVLKKLWASDFTVNTPFNRITMSSQELIEMIEKGLISFSTFTRTIERVLLKDDMAITMGSEEVVPVGDSPNAGKIIKRRYTNIWMKDKEGWKLTFRHANNICLP